MVHERKLFYFNKYCHNRIELDPRLNPLPVPAPLLLRGLLTAVVTRTVSNPISNPDRKDVIIGIGKCKILSLF